MFVLLHRLRSAECMELLKQADIVVTNPPFSLFREFVAQLIEYDKKFIIIGHQNAIKYKEIFPLIKDNKIWLGYGFKGGAGHLLWLSITTKSHSKDMPFSRHGKKDLAGRRVLRIFAGVKP